jgi:hypothetical protein
MPFIEQTPRPFTHSDISSLNPNQRGVYGILRNPNVPTWIYVGQGDLRDRLLAHLNGTDDNPCILRERPTHWVGEVKVLDLDERERQLILELNPICNRKVG